MRSFEAIPDLRWVGSVRLDSPTPRHLRSFRMNDDFEILGRIGKRGDWLIIENDNPLIVNNKEFQKTFFEL